MAEVVWAEPALSDLDAIAGLHFCEWRTYLSARRYDSSVEVQRRTDRLLRADRSGKENFHCLPTFGRTNSRDDGCDEQQPKCEFPRRILCRPANTGSVSLGTGVVPFPAMPNRVQGVAEAY